MDEIIESLARQAGIEGVDPRKLRVFAESIMDSKDREINQLKSQLFTAKAQNEIYRGALYDSH